MKLTDEELAEAMEVANSLHSLRLVAVVAELKERRAADLTDEERKALRWLSTRPWLRTLAGTTHLGPPITRALATLDRLLGGKP